MGTVQDLFSLLGQLTLCIQISPTTFTKLIKYLLKFFMQVYEKHDLTISNSSPYFVLHMVFYNRQYRRKQKHDTTHV